MSQVLHAFSKHGRMTCGRVSQLTGLHNHETASICSRLIKLKRLSREKTPGKLTIYFLTPDQEDAFYGKVVKNQYVLQGDVVALPRKLRFLRDIAERPAFDGDAILRSIIADYERTLSLMSRGEMAK